MKYKKNTVKGQRRGSKWPEAVKTAAMAALLFDSNLSAVAKRYGVPESTLRTWQRQAQKLDAQGKQSVWDAARADAIREVTVKAAQSARLAQELLERKLAIGLENHEKREEIERQLAELGPESAHEEPEVREKRAQLQHRLLHAQPMGDFAATNILRALTSVSEAGAREQAQQQGAGAIEIVMSDEMEEMSR